MPDLMDFSGEEDYSDDEDEHTHGYPHPQHRLFSHIAEQTRSPGGTTIIRTEGPGFSYVTARTTYNTTRPPRTPGVADDEVIADLFSTMLRNIVGDQYAARNRHAANQEGHQEGNTGESGEDRSGQPHFHPFASGFGGERLNPRNADSSQAGEPPQVSDINTQVQTSE